MRRVRSNKRGRGRWVSLLIAAVVGYLLGNWHSASVSSTDLSASQNVALRFLEGKADAAIVEAAAETTETTSNITVKEARLALLSPQPMVSVAAPPAPGAAKPEIVASLPSAVIVPASQPAPAVVLPRPRAEAKLPQPPRAEPKSPPPAPPAAAPQQASRLGFLNDAQIASIKARLHLTADQARMWPAVEAALRNIAYAKERFARHHSTTENTQTAALDSDSAEVQGLKSAAIPLLMSFNDEQKNEVRSLAHTMGLDQLAEQF
jgi:hypothetical protein